jgi:hypothetical protein
VTKKKIFITLTPGGTESFITGGLVFAKMLELMLDWLIWCQHYKNFFVAEPPQSKSV